MQKKTMTDFQKGTYKIISTNAGFSKVERPDRVLHNLSDKTIGRLKSQDGFNFVKVEIVEQLEDKVAIPKASDNKEAQLKKLNKAHLIELANRLGAELPDDTEKTKADIIKYILENDK